jgi:hypothetical protein
LKKNILRLSYIILQTLFLPVLLKLDEMTGGQFFVWCGVYTVLVIVDAYLGILIFSKDK